MSFNNTTATAKNGMVKTASDWTDASERLEYDEIVEVIGEPEKTKGGYSYWQCPDCKDDSYDNLQYCHRKKLLKTFCCDASKRLFKEILDKRKVLNHPAYYNFTNTSELSVTDCTVREHNRYLLQDRERLTFLEKQRGITADTVADLRLGFVKESNCWIIPNYSLENIIIGFEFRTHDFKKSNTGRKLWRSKGAAKQLCRINKPIWPENAIILEGFLDGILFYQYLKELGLHNTYQIITPANGVNFIADLMAEFDISKYKKVILFLDNDNAGKKGLQNTALKVNYPIYQLKFPRLDTYCKDFNEWYLQYKDNGELIENIKLNPLSIAKQYINQSCSIGNEIKVKIDEEISLFKQLIIYNNCYYEVRTEEKENKRLFCYIRLTNYSIDFHKEIIKYDEFDNPNSSLNACITHKDGEKVNIVLSGNSKQDITDFKKNISNYGSYAGTLNSTHLAQIIDSIDGLEKIYCYESTGLIKNSNLWLYSNSVVDMNTGNIFEIDKDGIIDIYGKKIMSDNKTCKKAVLKVSDEYNQKELAELLINNIKNTYPNSIEPFIVLGTAIMSPFCDILRTKTNNGFPVCYIQGIAGSGKTSIANIISHLYGFNENYIISGTSTNNAITTNLGKLNKLPVIIDEYPVRNNFEELVKNLYEGLSREIMKKDGIDKVEKKINSTAIFISNFFPPDNEQVMSRLNFVTFNPNNFVVEKAKEFNEIRDNHLSTLAPAFLSFPQDKILGYFNTYTALIKELNPSINGRSSNNLAIAFTGIAVLLEISGMQHIDDITNSMIEYTKNFGELCKAQSSLDIFLSYLTTLKANNKVEINKDYKFESSGKLAIYLSDSLMNAFSKEYKSVTGNVRTLSKIDIINSAKSDERVEHGKGQLTKTVNLGGKPKKCLVIDINNDEELQSLNESSTWKGAF